MKYVIRLVCLLAIPLSALAGNEPVKWVGMVYDLPSSHTTNHSHSLLFEEQDSKNTFDIVDSPEIEKLHHDTDKNYRVEIDGYLTSKFLFWGGNLVVTKFNVLEETNAVGLSDPPMRQPHSFSERR